jgi:DNA-binding FadR family transcriptional regulator
MVVTLRRETLAGQVAQHLLVEIESGQLSPGDTLPSEAQLAARYNVSRPIVREALKTLAARGIVEIVNGRGALVKAMNSDPIRDFFQRAVQLNRQTIIDLLELRRGIEIQSATLAAQRRTPEDLAELRRLTAQMRACLHDPVAYSALDLNLHLRIASASRNMMLYYLVESIRQQLHDTILEGMRRRNSAAEYERVQVLHEELLEALERGAPLAAGQAMAQHFDEASMHLPYEDQAAHVIAARAPHGD